MPCLPRGKGKYRQVHPSLLVFDEGVLPAELPQQGAKEAAGGSDTARLGPGEGSSPGLLWADSSKL